MANTAEQFLEWLNKKPAQKELFPSGDLAFTQKIDFVLWGTCSTGNGHGYFAHTLSADKSPNPAFFDPEITAVRGGRVLLISDCCGGYSARFQEQLRNMYPDVEWIVPAVGDFCERIEKDRVICNLIWLNFLHRHKV